MLLAPLIAEGAGPSAATHPALPSSVCACACVQVHAVACWAAHAAQRPCLASGRSAMSSRFSACSRTRMFVCEWDGERGGVDAGHVACRRWGQADERSTPGAVWCGVVWCSAPPAATPLCGGAGAAAFGCVGRQAVCCLSKAVRACLQCSSIGMMQGSTGRVGSGHLRLLVVCVAVHVVWDLGPGAPCLAHARAAHPAGPCLPAREHHPSTPCICRAFSWRRVCAAAALLHAAAAPAVCLGCAGRPVCLQRIPRAVLVQSSILHARERSSPVPDCSSAISGAAIAPLVVVCQAGPSQP